MSRSPEQVRTVAFSMVVLGFAAELAAIGLLASGRRSPAVLGVLIAGMFLVVGALALLASRRS